MGTTADKLNKLIESKAAIKAAIKAKGVADVGDVLADYPDKIASIPSGSGGTGEKFDITNYCLGSSDFVVFDPTPFDFSKKTDFTRFFYNCLDLTTVPYFDTSKAVYFASTFYDCIKLVDVAELDTSNVINFNNTFDGCIVLKDAPAFNTSSALGMNSMFMNCQNLTTVPMYDTTNVTNMSSMFRGCLKVVNIPSFNTTNVTDMSYMFYGCNKLEIAPAFNTTNVTKMGSMFYQCTGLTTVPLLDTTNVTDVTNMFRTCNSLTNLSGFTGLKVNLDLSYSSGLTVDSVMNVINNAADMSSSAKTLTLHANVFAQLSEEQIQTAAAKGWNIAQK